MRTVSLGSLGLGTFLLVLSVFVAAPTEELLQVSLRLAVAGLVFICIGGGTAALAVVAHVMGRPIRW